MAELDKPSSQPQRPQKPTQFPMKPWYSHLTLDVFVRVLSRSMFHPAIVMIFYLCLAGMHKHKTNTAHYTLFYAAFLMGIEMLIWANHRLTYGAGRTMDWNREVVVITGGGRGLGRVMVEMLVRTGASVGVLEMVEKDEGVGELEDSYDLHWEKCDTSKAEEVERGIGNIVDELGPPTMLILNAAAPINALPLLPSSTFTNSSPASPTPSSKHVSVPRSLTASQAAHTIAVNTLSHFNLLHATLPYLTTASTKATSSGATIVTISSILAHLQPSHLSDYTASKSASSAIHASLTHEIRSHSDPAVRSKLKTLLVETGQIDTALFSNTKLPWYAAFFGPVLDSNDVAKHIMNILGSGQGGVLRMPFYARVVGGPLWGLMPGGLKRGLRWWTGIDGAMREGVGKGEKER